MRKRRKPTTPILWICRCVTVVASLGAAMSLGIGTGGCGPLHDGSDPAAALTADDNADQDVVIVADSPHPHPTACGEFAISQDDDGHTTLTLTPSGQRSIEIQVKTEEIAAQAETGIRVGLLVVAFQGTRNRISEAAEDGMYLVRLDDSACSGALSEKCVEAFANRSGISDTITPAHRYTTIRMHQWGLMTYYVQASMPGSGAVQFMVDTGAGYTAINEVTLRRLKDAKNAEYVGQVTGVFTDDSRHELPVYRIKHLGLGEDCDCVLQDVEAAVFPGNTRMLLGLSALEKAAPFVFSTDPPRLSLSKCGR